MPLGKDKPLNYSRMAIEGCCSFELASGSTSNICIIECHSLPEQLPQVMEKHCRRVATLLEICRRSCIRTSSSRSDEAKSNHVGFAMSSEILD